MLQLGTSGLASSIDVADVLAGLDQLHAFSALSGASCKESINFALSATTAFGVSQSAIFLSGSNRELHYHLARQAPFFA